MGSVLFALGFWVYQFVDAARRDVLFFLFSASARVGACAEGLAFDSRGVRACVAKAVLVKSWEDVAPRVRPQLCPVDHLQRAPVAHQDLGAGLLAAVVVDGEASYSFVTEAHLLTWRISFEDLLRYAGLNLNEASSLSCAPVQLAPPPDLLLTSVTRDGFDAARILIPEFRRFVSERLGSPFLWAVPHRDCLLCWSVQNTESFGKFIRQRVADEFASARYPLSLQVFEGDCDQMRPWHQARLG